MEYDTMQGLKKIYNSLSLLKTSFTDLNDIIMDNKIVSKTLIEDDSKYPFDNSFDKAYLNIIKWSNNIQEKIQAMITTEDIYHQIKRMNISDDIKKEIAKNLLKQLEYDECHVDIME